ncbi:S1/P1 nuclease, partial [Blastocladiella britannica]
TAGGGTAGSHFIDFDDNPTAGQCTSAVVPDDCNGSASCVTTAIGQFAAQLAKSSPTSTDAVYALSLVIHYTGDSAQPLHASGYARGSNDVPAKFSGSSSKNMHSVWDTALPRARISKAGSQDAWTTKLSTLVTPAQAGTACIASASITSASDISACALKWAKESEALACSVVYGPKYTSTGDLSTGYATAAGPTVDQQVAKAGLRLSAILNKALGGK